MKRASAILLFAAMGALGASGAEVWNEQTGWWEPGTGTIARVQVAEAAMVRAVSASPRIVETAAVQGVAAPVGAIDAVTGAAAVAAKIAAALETVLARGDAGAIAAAIETVLARGDAGAIAAAIETVLARGDAGAFAAALETVLARGDAGAIAAAIETVLAKGNAGAFAAAIETVLAKGNAGAFAAAFETVLAKGQSGGTGRADNVRLAAAVVPAVRAAVESAIATKWYERYSAPEGSHLWWICEVARARAESDAAAADALERRYFEVLADWINEDDAGASGEDSNVH